MTHTSCIQVDASACATKTVALDLKALVVAGGADAIRAAQQKEAVAAFASKHMAATLPVGELHKACGR